MTQPLLRVRDLSMGFARTMADGSPGLLDALSGIHFDLHAGETLALLGESGCGKSLTALALMRLLPGNARYVSGQVLLQPRDGGRYEDLLRLSEHQMRGIRGQRMAMIFQEPATSLNPVMRIGEQIAEVMIHGRARDASQKHALVLDLLAQVGLPDPERAIKAYPFELSGGMKQRAMIAMALAGDPQVLLADEPTTALDVTLQAQILDLMRDLQQQRQMGTLLITHDLGVVASRADRVAVMYAGQIVETGPVSEVLNHPGHPYTRALLAALPECAQPGQPLMQLGGRVPPLGKWPMACRFSPRCADREPHCEAESPPLATLPRFGRQDVSEQVDVPHAVLCWRAGEQILNPLSPMHEGIINRHVGGEKAEIKPVLALEQISMTYAQPGIAWLNHWRGLQPPAMVVNEISLEVCPGETVALVGESGCGKSTIARGILGLLPVAAGVIRLEGGAIAGPGVRPFSGWRRDVQMVFQDPFASLDPRQRIRDILAEGPRALGMPADRTSNAALTALLDRVGLPAEALHRYPHEFSGGQRQRIAIARALAVGPKLLICDEPTSALDVSVQAQILNLLRDLQRETGMAYLFITHNFGVVRYLADRVVVMQAGRIVERGSVNQIFENPQEAYTRRLLASVPVVAMKG